MWIRQDNGRGSWPYDGEIELGYGAALRTAATIVADDPLFGWFAYGGRLEVDNSRFKVWPQDGLRQRVHIVGRSTRLHVLLERDGFAAEQPVSLDYAYPDTEDMTPQFSKIAFSMDNRSGDRHTTDLRLSGLRGSSYAVRVDGDLTRNLDAGEKDWSTIAIEVVPQDVVRVEIEGT